MAPPKTARRGDAVVTPRKRGAGAPNANGGQLRAPWPKGVSGNPSGRPSKQPITEAYKKILALPATILGNFVPQTQAELVAWNMIRRAASQTDKLAVVAAREMTDRVEGPPLQKHQHGGTDGEGPVRVRLEFTARGAQRQVELLPPAQGEGDGE